MTRVGKNGANGVRHREGVLDLQAGLPTGGLCRIIPDTNLDQRPIPQPSGPRGSFGMRHSRRSCAKMCRAAGGELEQIQLLLGHASVQTTERYLGTKQDLVHAPNDGIKLRVV